MLPHTTYEALACLDPARQPVLKKVQAKPTMGFFQRRRSKSLTRQVSEDIGMVPQGELMPTRMS